MELEPVYIPIRKVDNVRHAYLGLEGTILLFDQRQAAIDSELLIPVELVTISEGRRFKGRRLIAALLCLLLPLLLCGLSAGLLSGCRPTEEIDRHGRIADPRRSSSWGLFLRDWSRFSILLVMFFFRVKTVRLQVGPSGRGGRRMPSSSTRHRRQAATIDEFRRANSPAAGPCQRVSCGPGPSARRLYEGALDHSPAGGTAVAGQLAGPDHGAGFAAAPAPWGFWSGSPIARSNTDRQPREYRQAIRIICAATTTMPSMPWRACGAVFPTISPPISAWRRRAYEEAGSRRPWR